MRLRPTGCLWLCVAAVSLTAQEPAWNPNAVKDCDRACLVGVMDAYLDVMSKRDPRAVPRARDYRMTENSGQIRHVEAAPFVTLPVRVG